MTTDLETTQAVTPEAPLTPGVRRELKSGEYVSAIGRRKVATAQVRVTPAKKTQITVNGREYTSYFPAESQQKIITDPVTKSKSEENFEITVVVRGGGLHAQAEATRHGIARALTLLDSAYRMPLKKLGFLKRDPRKKERKKFGLRGARRAPQWSKR